MKLKLHGKDIKVGDGLRRLSEKKFTRLDKFFNDEQEMNVKFSEEGIEKKVEATIFLKGGTILRGEQESESFESSIDAVMDALVRQIRKNKTKLEAKKQNGDSIKFESFLNSNFEDDVNDEEIKIVKTKTLNLEPMLREEAILQMELLNHNFFVFLDGDTEKVSVVYKRKNGNYGLIETDK
ncbi:MAG: ribosome-associated translation inhibitor RaiA [Peptoniphilaceae bacterium]|nr:ribosome-associated translation inhibitor RaiA [Peptoniphilaceae bacterium]MDD7383939.1 ribosome-associated translation inhibitor RaiA [Peptoniphilaceae bacterium]MDY3738082.1 ribosome-associated translation inhibitor RaiA [Peptoniphilaceae bacterium]